MGFKDKAKARKYNRDWYRKKRDFPAKMITCPWCLEQFTPNGGYTAHEQMHKREEEGQN